MPEPTLKTSQTQSSVQLPEDEGHVTGGGVGFPQSPTVIVGIWLLFFVIFSTVGFFMALSPPTFLREQFPGFQESIQQAILAIFAAGVGSSLPTISGYLKYAAEQQNFKGSYAPWYVGRPIMGMLLGLIFYALLKGGLLVVLSSGNSAQLEMDNWAVAALAAVAGMFSKNAIEKLRDVFHTIFQTKESTNGQREDDSNKPNSPEEPIQ